MEAIRKKVFPTTLKGLETGLGLFGYYRKCIANYATIVEPIQHLKTIGFKASPIKGRPRDRYAETTQIELNANLNKMTPEDREKLILQAKEAWETVKSKLTSAPILAYPDFSKPFKLYVDRSKEHSFGVAIHQVQDGVERPILFLSRCLKPSERGYWATELETAALVWALQKVPFYFDSGDFEVITDYAPILGLHKEAKGRRSQRLDEWALFLLKFSPRMKIIHRAGRQHANADGLSRLHDQQEPGRDKSEAVVTPSFAVSVMELDEGFLNRIREDIMTDSTFALITKKLDEQRTRASKTGEQTENREWAYHNFILKTDGLLYH